MSENENDHGKKTPIEKIFREIAKREMTPNERARTITRTEEKEEATKAKITQAKTAHSALCIAGGAANLAFEILWMADW